jgi:hypothetical protein
MEAMLKMKKIDIQDLKKESVRAIRLHFRRGICPLEKLNLKLSSS